jgi:serine/threonine protein kinase
LAGGPAAEQPGDQIGAYKLRSIIGEGGFGIVWLAEQLEPVRRQVALKIIKPGMDSKAVIARFEAERQALAVMDHPSVAKVFDAGTTAREMGSRPYFVMEYVRGEPITKYCDRHRLSTRQRLEMFIPVCEAIQHAHSKGVIHRDIKPSNILVKPGDPGAGGADSGLGGAIPKVIDFGVAKAISHTAPPGRHISPRARRERRDTPDHHHQPEPGARSVPSHGGLRERPAPPASVRDGRVAFIDGSHSTAQGRILSGSGRLLSPLVLSLTPLGTHGTLCLAREHRGRRIWRETS